MDIPVKDLEGIMEMIRVIVREEIDKTMVVQETGRELHDTRPPTWGLYPRPESEE